MTKKQFFRIRVLAFAIFVCAWLLPTCAGVAASASSKVKVSVAVVDAVGINVGKSVLDTASENPSCQIIKEFVTQTGSSRLSGRMVLDELSRPRAITEFALPFGQKEDNAFNGTGLSDQSKFSAIEESELIVTVSNL
ncbi:MAG: hypothetical protein ACYC0L_02750 [Thermoleophilia bacterium]